MLWIQAPLFVLLLLVATRSWLSRPPPASVLPRRLMGVALVVPILLGFALPGSDYHFSGHEGAYAELLAGALPERADLTSHRTFALPAGLAWAFGKVLPERLAEVIWLGGNRAALAVVLLLLAEGSYSLHLRSWPPDEGRSQESGPELAGGLAILAACTTPPLLGWSATGFAVVPALALGLLSLRLGLAGRPGFVLAFGACAIATRMESAPLVLAGLLLCPAAVWRDSLRRDRLAGVGAGLGLLVLQVLTLVLKTARLPVEEGTGGAAVAIENLSNLPLGGPVLGALAGGLAAALVFRVGWPRQTFAALGLGTAAALGQPLLLVDLGARHLLTAVVLTVLLAAPSASRALLRRGVLLRAVAAAWLLAVLLPGIAGVLDLDRRYMTGFDAVPRGWDTALAGAPRGSAEQVLQSSCHIVMPGGGAFREGAADTMDVREVHLAARALSGGRCVQWVVENDFEFSGDTRAERLDRAVRTIGLRPEAWLDPPPRGGRPWVVLRADPPAGYASVRPATEGQL